MAKKGGEQNRGLLVEQNTQSRGRERWAFVRERVRIVRCSLLIYVNHLDGHVADF